MRRYGWGGEGDGLRLVGRAIVVVTIICAIGAAAVVLQLTS